MPVCPFNSSHFLHWYHKLHHVTVLTSKDDNHISHFKVTFKAQTYI